jgi:transcriptional regulator with XRE-family HTH domain
MLNGGRKNRASETIMTFVALQEALRRELRKRIDAGELTGMELARRTGFTQAHISNFLNRKRGLKLAALDRTLKAIDLSLYDLVNPHELARFAALPAGSESEETPVPIVSSEAAAVRAIIVREDARGMARYRRTLLARLRPDPAVAARRSWTRFVALEAGTREAAAMSPRFAPGSLLLVDRHYTTLQPYRKGEPSVYAVRRDGACVVRYVETSGPFLVLRPHNSNCPVEVIQTVPERTPPDLIVGRISHIAMEV